MWRKTLIQVSTETAQFELGGMGLSLLLSFPKQKYPKSELKHTFPDTPESPITGGGPIGRGALLAPYTLGKNEREHTDEVCLGGACNCSSNSPRNKRGR